MERSGAGRRNRRLRRRGGSFILLFHDTHHRAVSDPEAIRAFDLTGYDGVLAFGQTLADVYRRWGWGDRVWTWHEAADTRLFHPSGSDGERAGLVWIGNWGDGERTREIEDFLLRPAAEAGLPLDIYGVRYPDEALAMLQPMRRAIVAGRPTRGCRRSSRKHSPPSMCHVAAIRRSCPASPPSACSRRSPAACRWSPRHGTMPSSCFAPAPTTWSPPMAQR